MNYPRSTWRLLVNGPARGAWNMAVDEAILELIGRQKSLATLRLYAWEPPCLSIGYTQPLADVDLTRLEQHGWDLVRRPTGGRAILHTDELTYSVIGPQTDPRFSGSVLESYRRLSTALLQALHLLQIPAETSPEAHLPAGAGPRGPVCFEVPSNYELTVGGRKIIGSAQARRKEGVLQHGSLPLTGDLGRISQVLVFSNEAQRREATDRLHARAATAEEILGAPPAWKTAALCFQQAFSESLSLELVPGDLSPAELHHTEELVESKYSHPSWTGRL